MVLDKTISSCSLPLSTPMRRYKEGGIAAMGGGVSETCYEPRLLTQVRLTARVAMVTELRLAKAWFLKPNLLPFPEFRLKHIRLDF